MIDLEVISFYLPYELRGKYRIGDVVDNARNPDEIRDKKLTPDNVEFFCKYCTPILRPIEEINTLKIEFGDKEIFFHELAFGKKTMRDFYKEFLKEDCNMRYWFDKAPFGVTQKLFKYHFKIF
jgi:hypothetical protein